MLIEAATVPSDTTLRADVCIVGAGPAGITLARELERGGLRVCLLESGGLGAEPGPQALNRGEIAGDWEQPLEQVRQRRMGGTAHGWAERIGFRRPGGRFVPLAPADFERREGMPHDGWPFGFAALRPYYERAQRICRLGPFAYDGAAWQTPASPPLPLPGDAVQSRVFQVGRRSVFTDEHPAALAASRRVAVVLHASVLRLESDETDNAVRRACVVAGNGRRFTATATLFVLALGAIENARLLLLSSTACPAGLGNEHDLVGRYLMEHPQVYTGLLVPFAAQTLRRAGLYDTHVVAGVPVMGHLTLADAALRGGPLAGAGMMLFPRPGPAEIAAADTAWRLLRRPRRLRTAGAMSLRELAAGRRYLWPLLLRTFTRPQPFLPRLGWGGWSAGPAGGRGFVAFETLCLAEQAPRPENRVTLGGGRDRLGQRPARVEWRWSDADRDALRRSLDVFAAAFARAGAGYFRPPLDAEVITLSHHHLGTTRMHASPRCGVVDADCRVHGLGNLYVAGSSVFPTGGYANPTLTIVALAIRLADHLKHRLARPLAAVAGAPPAHEVLAR